MRKKLIALDMDGTFLNHKKEIPEENKQAVFDAIKAGHQVMICSGRPHGHLMKYLKEEGLGALPVSACNGSLSIVDGQTIDVRGMDKTVAKQAFDWLNAHEYPFNIYTNEDIYSQVDMIERARVALELVPPEVASGHINLDMLEAYIAKNNVVKIQSFDDIPPEIQVLKFYVFTPAPKEKKAFETFAHTLPGLTVTSSFGDNVEISDALGHKGTGLKAVADYFNIPMEDTVAMGDNFNDEGMLAVAGLAVAMENGEPGVKEMCHVTTLSNDACGVAYAIYNYVLNSGE